MSMIPLSSNINSYADNSKLSLTATVEDIEITTVNLEKNLRNVANWCSEHQLPIIADKMKFLLIGSRSMLQNLPTDIS